MKFWTTLLIAMVMPSISRAAEPAPAASVVWDFDSGITNHLGGQYNTYKRAPSWARTYLDPEQARGGQGHALRITSHREAEGFCGVWLDFGQASEAPRQTVNALGMRYLSFWAKGANGGEDFEISLTDASNADDERRPTRRLRAYMPGGLTTSWRQVLIPLADFRGLDPRRLLRVTLSLTRRGDSRFYLDDIGFQRGATGLPVKKTGNPVRSTARPEAPRAMWAWNTKLLFDSQNLQEATRFLAFCAEQRISVIFLAAEFNRAGAASPGLHLRNPEGYRAFVKRARQQGLTVEALAGTPEWAMREYHAEALAALDAVIAFNQSSQPDERFQGVHFDVEPYLLVGYSDPGFRGEILLGLVEKAEKCRDRAHAAGLTFGSDLPSWFFVPGGLDRDRLMVNYRGQEKTAGEHMVDLVDSVTIMDYTNQADGAGGIIARALPALQYAASSGKKIVIGVETFAERDSTVAFILGLPAEEFWPRLARSGLRGQLRFEDFRVSLHSDDVNVHIGLSTPRDMTPETRVAFDGALARLARQFGASSDPDRYHPFEMLDTARAGFEDDPDWKGFEPFDLTDPETGRRIQGFRSTYRMHPNITFHGLGRETFEEEIASTVEWLSRHPSFGGVAVHFYDSFRELMEQDSGARKQESGVRRQKSEAKGK